MPTQVNIGHGTLLKLKIAATYTTIAQRVSIQGPGLKVPTVDTTHLDSPAREKRPTLPDPGSLKMQVEFDPTDPTHKAMFDLIFTPVVAQWKLVFTDSAPTGWAFDGILTGFEPGGMTVDGNLTADVEIEVTGVVVQAAEA